MTKSYSLMTRKNGTSFIHVHENRTETGPTAHKKEEVAMAQTTTETLAAARREGAAAFRQTMAAVMDSPEARGREAFAADFAGKLAEAGVAAESIVKLLADVPRAAPEGYRTIEQRAAAEKEIGGWAQPMGSTKGETTEDGWNAELKAAGAQ